MAAATLLTPNDTGQPAAQGMSRNDLSFTDLASGQVSPATLAPVLPSSSAGPVPAPGDLLAHHPTKSNLAQTLPKPGSCWSRSCFHCGSQFRSRGPVCSSLCGCKLGSERLSWCAQHLLNTSAGSCCAPRPRHLAIFHYSICASRPILHEDTPGSICLLPPPLGCLRHPFLALFFFKVVE